MSLQQKIDRITDILRRDDGISGAMHYTEQTSWVLFLKFLDDYESEKEDEAVLSGKDYQPVLDDEHRWASWACPKAADGELDLARAKTGDDLTNYVNKQLFPYLKSFANAAATGVDPKSFTYKIGAIFQYLDNKIASGHTLREVLDIVDSLNFQSESELFELSLVYEGLLQNMGDAGGYAGEFYTPRPVVRAMVQTIDPQPRETVYDAAAGSCGFLVEAFEHLKSKKSQFSTEQWDFIQRDTFFGFEKTTLAYVMGMMNMILHGIESPNLFRGNTLTQNIRDIQEKDRYDIILANPPFGGKEKSQIQQNFPIQSNATELLFLQHFMKTLKSGGKAAIVVPEGILFQTNSAFKQVKQELLDNFNLHTILSLPAGVFLPYSAVKTNVLFFERKGGTSDVWYYECEPSQRLTKNKPLSDEHLKEFVKLYSSRRTTARSWIVPASELSKDFNLSAKNPSKPKSTEHDKPGDIFNRIRIKEDKVRGLLDEFQKLLAGNDFCFDRSDWKSLSLEELGSFSGGGTPSKSQPEYWNGDILWVTPKDMKSPTITDSEIKITPQGVSESSAKHIPARSILIVARSGILRHTLPVCINQTECTVNQDIKVFIPGDEIIPEYVQIMLKGFEPFILSELVKGGVTVESLKYKEFQNFKFPVPPISAQKDIVDQLSFLNRLAESIQLELYEKMASVKKLQSSVLNSVFSSDL